MKRIQSISIFLFFAISISFVGCKWGPQNLFYRSPQVDERSGSLAIVHSFTEGAPFGALGSFYTKPDNEGKLLFLITTDIHYGNEAPLPDDVVFDSASIRKPDAILMLGDSAEAGLQSSFDAYENFLERLRKITQPNVGQFTPDYAILGNHDLYNAGLNAWKKVRRDASETITVEGNTTNTFFYKFVTNTQAGTSNNPPSMPRSWYFLDSASSTLGSKQLKALEEAFKNDPNPKFVFSHYPLYAETNLLQYFKWSDTRERAFLINLFDKNNVNMFFSGHWHNGETTSYGNFVEVCCGSYRTDLNKKYHWYYVTVDEVAQTIELEEFRANSDRVSGEKIITVFNFNGKTLSGPTHSIF